LILRLTDVNAGGVPNLWAVAPGSIVTAYVITNPCRRNREDQGGRPAAPEVVAAEFL